MKEYQITKSGWMGTDLDGTLAIYEGWQGAHHIGPPIPEHEARVRSWLEEGFEVRIVTARASDPEQIPHVKAWLKKYGFPDLQVTNEKDYGMLQLWDDRTVQVIPNTGKSLEEFLIKEMTMKATKDPEGLKLAEELQKIIEDMKVFQPNDEDMNVLRNIERYLRGEPKGNETD
jgi:hypothetical protein